MTIKPKGKLIIFSAPSGAGKTTIVKHLLQKNFDLEFSISATSREARHTESHGKDYYFLTQEDFQSRIDNEEFLEWEEVYKGTCYGTLKSEVDRILNLGKNVIFDVDVIGGMNIKKQYGNEALAIFVQAPSVEELKNRLISRSTESQEKIAMRISKAESEMVYAKDFDVILVNDKLEDCFLKAEKVLSNFLNT